jgi:transcriptional regulator with XRE-family HTH domain
VIEMALEQRAIGRRIAELREDRRLTQPVVADRVGVSLRAYQKWEAGTSAPAWRNLEQLAEVFQVSADYLLGAAQDRRQDAQDQLDRIEAEVAATRAELGEVLTRLTEMQRSLARRRSTAALPTRSQKAK